MFFLSADAAATVSIVCCTGTHTYRRTYTHGGCYIWRRRRRGAGRRGDGMWGPGRRGPGRRGDGRCGRGDIHARLARGSTTAVTEWRDESYDTYE